MIIRLSYLSKVDVVTGDDKNYYSALNECLSIISINTVNIFDLNINTEENVKVTYSWIKEILESEDCELDINIRDLIHFMVLD